MENSMGASAFVTFGETDGKGRRSAKHEGVEGNRRSPFEILHVRYSTFYLFWIPVRLREDWAQTGKIHGSVTDPKQRSGSSGVLTVSPFPFRIRWSVLPIDPLLTCVLGEAVSQS